MRVEWQSWKVYFSESLDPKSELVVRLNCLLKFYLPLAERLVETLATCDDFIVDFENLKHHCPISSLNEWVSSFPEQFLRSVAVVIHDICHLPLQRQLRIRLINFEAMSLRNLKSYLIGKMVALRGAVVRVSAIKPLITGLTFACQKCGDQQRHVFVDGKFTPPTACGVPGCRSRTYIPVRSHAETVDWQRVRIQELGDDDPDSGRIPRTVECELTDKLVDSCVPGDVVVVTGIVKVLSAEAGARAKSKSLFVMYLDTNSLVNSKRDATEASTLQPLVTRDLYAIQQIAQTPRLFHLICNSVCPAIYGHEAVKAGLSLALFGGCQKYAMDKDHVAIRGDPHVLIVGDPGMGKSQMLHAISCIAPRGVYVSGNTTTTSGLTVTVLKDAATGDYALEAGALVLGDQGLCCIDEFDKMGQEHQSLLEAMEQQHVSVAKAGIVCSLPTRTSVVAAANPIGGHYNRSKTVAENLRISSAILSRFDLIFLLLDSPDTERDQILSEHVINLHKSNRINTLPSYPTVAQDDDRPLSQQLRVENCPQFEPIGSALLRKYVAYARKYVHPRLTPEAGAILQRFYLTLRRQKRSADAVPITTRQFESLLRLAEARAKIELREFVCETDAKDVVSIMQESLFDLLSDDFGNVDFRRSTGMSRSHESKRFMAEVLRVCAIQACATFGRDELRVIARDLGMNVDGFDEFLDLLNCQGYLLKKGGRRYQVASSQYSRS